MVARDFRRQSPNTRDVTSDDDEQTLFDVEVDRGCDPRNLIGIVVTLSQIFAATLDLTLAKKDEQQPENAYVTLIICYTCGCIVTLPTLCWRLCPCSPSFRAGRRIMMVAGNLKKMFEFFFVGWVVVLLWHLVDNFPSLNDTTHHFWLCMAFLAISFIRHVIPNLGCAAICFMFPLIIRLSQVFDYIDDFEDYGNYAKLAFFALIWVLMGICQILASCCGGD